MAFHPSPQVIRAVCNLHRFGPPCPIKDTSPCSWGAHTVSGLPPATIALFRLAFATAPAGTALTTPQRVTRRVILQKARCHIINDAPTAWKHTISGSLSLPSPGYFSPFPHGTVRYRSLGVGSLGGWSPQLPTRFFVPGSTQEQAPRVSSFHYPAITVFGCVFQTPSCHLIQNVCSSADEPRLPYNPNHATAAALARDWFGQNPVRSPLLRVFFLFLGLR